MKKNLLFRLTILIGLLFAASCSVIPGAGSNQLSGTTWKLISYANNIPLAGKDMTASFDAKEIRGSASCNSYFGAYRLKGDQISIGELGWTEMACMDPDGPAIRMTLIFSARSSIWAAISVICCS